MAQTTPDASFEPVFVVAAFHLTACRVLCSLQAIYTKKTLVSIKKIRRKKKKNNLGPKRRQTRRLGPLSSSLASTACILSLETYNNKKTSLLSKLNKN